jgi:hypothetical protein
MRPTASTRLLRRTGPSSRASLGRNRSPEFAFGVKVAIYFSNFAASSEPPVTLPAE